MTADLTELVTAFPADVVVTDAARTGKYRQDRANDPDAGHPLAVVRAESTEQGATALRWAARHGVSVVIRCAGTGLSGGSTAQSGAIVLSTERMRAITIDRATRTAIVQP